MKAKQYLTARKKHHVIYKTTCLVTNRYYIGMHSTDDLADGYIGSGIRLWKSIRKHGVEQHFCEVLEHLSSRAALRLREAELVNKELLEDKRCMNIALGGEGGWEQCNASGANRYPRKGNLKVLASLQKATKEAWRKFHADPAHAAKVKQNLSSSLKQLYANGYQSKTLGYKHTIETRAKLKETFSRVRHQRGENNSMYGKIWISNLVTREIKIVTHGIQISSPWVLGRNAWNKDKLTAQEELDKLIKQAEYSEKAQAKLKQVLLKQNMRQQQKQERDSRNRAVTERYQELKSLAKVGLEFKLSSVSIKNILDKSQLS